MRQSASEPPTGNTGPNDPITAKIAHSAEALDVLLVDGPTAYGRHIRQRREALTLLAVEVTSVAHSRGREPVEFLLSVLAGTETGGPAAMSCPRCGGGANHLGGGYFECCACGYGWAAW